MEPADMNLDESPDGLESMLRSPLQEELPDNGFTAQVLRSLPAPAAKREPRRRILSLRSVLIGAAALVGGWALLLREKSASLTAPPSLNLSHLGHELGVLVGDQSLLLALSLLTFSFATLYFLDADESYRE